MLRFAHIDCVWGAEYKLQYDFGSPKLWHIVLVQLFDIV